jgi:peroxiredoxin
VRIFISEDADTVKRFNAGARLSFPLLPDGDGRVSARYKVARHPHTVILDRRGLIVGRVDGERDWSSPLAREWIGKLLEGRK